MAPDGDCGEFHQGGAGHAYSSGQGGRSVPGGGRRACREDREGVRRGPSLRRPDDWSSKYTGPHVIPNVSMTSSRAREATRSLLLRAHCTSNLAVGRIWRARTFFCSSSASIEEDPESGICESSSFRTKGLSPWPRRHKMLCRRPRGRVPGSVAQNAQARSQGGPGGGDFRDAGVWTDSWRVVPAPGPRQARPSTMS